MESSSPCFSVCSGLEGISTDFSGMRSSSLTWHGGAVSGIGELYVLFPLQFHSLLTQGRGGQAKKNMNDSVDILGSGVIHVDSETDRPNMTEGSSRNVVTLRDRRRIIVRQIQPITGDLDG